MTVHSKGWPSLRFWVRGAIIAALYAVLTVALAPFGFGPFQVRASEALTVLPIFWPEAIFGLWFGCLIGNLASPFGIIDILGGSTVTLIAALATYALRRRGLVALLPPVVLNATLVSMWVSALTRTPYLWTAGGIAIGEAVSVGILGVPLLFALRRLPEQVLR
ncbi:MAG: QueT transporter family protein [Firmicutes bacterium]|nr:QueT transporter family protein [Bacillota bacterium]